MDSQMSDADVNVHIMRNFMSFKGNFDKSPTAAAPKRSTFASNYHDTSVSQSEYVKRSNDKRNLSEI